MKSIIPPINILPFSSSLQGRGRGRGFFFLPLLLSLLLSGCIEEYDADLPAAQTELLVVEGNICSSQLNTFTITRTIRYSVDPFGEIQEPIQASVAVRGSDGSECVAEETSYGVFRCMLGELSPDVEYWLHIEADGEVYESEPQRPLPTEEIADVHAVQSTPESDIDVIITPDAPAQPGTANYYTWTYDETWEVQPEYTTTIYYDTQLKRPVSKLGQFPERGWMDAENRDIIIGASRNYQDQHIRGMKIYDISRSSTKVWVKYSGLVHQRAISKGEYEYEMARRQASSEMGGLFTPQPSALPTNIRCLTSDRRVIGYVGCSLNTTERRFFINSIDFSIYHPLQPDRRMWLIDPRTDGPFDDLSAAVYYGYYLCFWEDTRDQEGGHLRTAWATRSQLDVREMGAYIEEPYFWSWEQRGGHQPSPANNREK